MNKLEEKLGHTFHDISLLRLALTHPSLNQNTNNQRLEFLGDAVLGLVVAKILYKLFPGETEGELARRLAALVRGETLTEVAKELALGEYLMVSESEGQSGGRQNPTNLEDAMEAVLGALYLDGGLEAAETFIAMRWSDMARRISAPPKDAKTALQEWAQARGLPVPDYQVIDTQGPAHAPEFTIQVRIQGHEPHTARANSKRVAEQQAAQSLLAVLPQ
ncbi:MAG: ribonuclease III [Rickettsiales bacterium]|jgi:ribonuclease-3|nr:ribonuclease III [Rickettsiales bacterium]